MFAQAACCATIDQWKQACKENDPLELELCSSVSEQHFNAVLKHLNDAHASFASSSSLRQANSSGDSKRQQEQTPPHAIVKRIDSMCTDKFIMVGPKQQLRQRTWMNKPDKPELISKQRLVSLDILILQRAYDTRMNLKREERQETIQNTKPVVVIQERTIKRVTFITTDHVCFDLSIVEQHDLQTTTVKKTYEIEIECVREGSSLNTEELFACLQYWTLFWMECLPKQVKLLFVPIEDTSLTKLQQDKNAKVMTVFTDSVWVLKNRL